MASVTIQKRPNGRFGVRLNRDGGETTWVGTFDLRRQAKAAGDAALSEYRNGRVPGSRRLTLERYWLDTLEPLHVTGNERLAENTRQSKRMIFRRHLLTDPIARVPLTQVSSDDVRRLQARLRTQTTARKRPLSPGSVNNALTQLSWAFNQARRRGLVSTNPCDNIPKIPEHHEPYFLNDQERERFLRSFRLPQDALLAEFMCETGLRKGEAFALTLAQVDERPLAVSRQLFQNCTTGPLKNRKPRAVGLSRRAETVMHEQRAWLREEWMRQGKGAPADSDYLWPGRWLGPMRRDTWDRAFKAAATAARLAITTHDLRHTYAATAIDAGFDIYVLARQLGDTLTVTERTYAHLYPEAHQRAAEALDRRRERMDASSLSSYSVAEPGNRAL
jgi:integrase